MVAITRTSLVLLALALAGPQAAEAAQSPQIPLPGSAIPQFVDPLPTLEVVDLTSGTDLTNPFVLRLKEFQAPVLSSTTVLPGGPYAGT